MNQWATVLLVLGMVGIPAALISVLVIWLMRRSDRKAAASHVFMGMPPLQWHSCLGEEGGPVFRFTPEKKNRNHKQPPLLEVALFCAIPCELKIRLKTQGDRWGLRLGLGRTLLTGDPPFDDLFYVEATSEGFAMDLLGKSEVREALLHLVRLGFTEFQWKSKVGTITASWSGYEPSPARDIVVVGEAIQGLELIRNGGAGLEAGPLPDWKLRNTLGLIWSCVWVGLVGVCLLAGFTVGLSEYSPLAGHWFSCALWCLPFLGLYLVPAWFFFRDSPQGHRSLGLWLFAVAVLGAVAVYPVYFTLNGWLDDGQIQSVKLPVRGASSSRGKYGTSYYALLDAQIHGHSVHKVSVDKMIHDQILARGLDSVDIDYGPGRFGFPWAKAMHFSKRPRK